MIIALENASSDPSIALAAPDGTILAVDGWSVGRRQGSDLLPRLLALLARDDRELRHATAVAVGAGPGSFTGLRVAMSVAKGLALALDIPVVAAPSLVAWLAAEPGSAAAVTRAGARDAFVLLRGEREPRIALTAELPAIVAGRGVVAPTELAEAAGLAGALTPHRAAGAIAEAVAARLAADPGGDDLDHLEPIYLRPAGRIGPTRGVVGWP
ncbi:MAG TPA: tRNA (adenosine(37)-N6)-threonylcarbamoyltransferase complex dimerization subunit type 1 TsaB [Candidatus Limnocylindria bacterium]|nr:tRNA (adenosine(37)-N6)-threonylcarbamoyltransferase complex dimerization subunit type 1 TsaB [Candidatus Limnocylindria bacterium]